MLTFTHVHKSQKYSHTNLLPKNRLEYTSIKHYFIYIYTHTHTHEPEIKFPTSAGSSKKQESSRKVSISALLTIPKPLTVWITINCGKFWTRWEYQATWPASWETCMQVRKQVRTGHGTTDWFQIGKGVRQGCILSLCLFNYMQSTSWETLDWKKHKLESRLPGEISITSDMQMTPPLWQKVKRN